MNFKLVFLFRNIKNDNTSKNEMDDSFRFFVNIYLQIEHFNLEIPEGQLKLRLQFVPFKIRSIKVY